ncbi:MAG: SDR family NAD(P)-dependent oxidoreductase, partial [Bacteroidia bacterium]
MLSGKTALITGASRGIGKGIAELFAQNGCNVAFTFASSVEKARAFEAELTNQYGIKAKGYQSNAADFAQSEALAQEVLADFGKVDILINNAGITRDTLLMRMNEEQWDEVINTNLKSAFNLTKAFLRHFLG